MLPSLLNYWYCSKPPEAWDTNDSFVSSGNFLWSLASFSNPSCRNQELTWLSLFITIKNKHVISGPWHAWKMPENMSWNQSQSSVPRRQYKNQKSLFKKKQKTKPNQTMIWSHSCNFFVLGSWVWMPGLGSVKSRHSKCPSKHMLLPHGLKQTINPIWLTALSNILKGKMILQRWHVGIWNEMNIVPVKVQ